MFADRLQSLGTENAFKLADHITRVLATGQDVVKLNLGEPDFDAPEHVAAEAKAQIDAGNGHYCHPAGIEPLRKAIARQVSETRGLDIDFRRVVVHPGGKPSIAYTMLSYVNPGDEVIYPSPGFPVYESWVTFVGAKPVPMRLRESAGFAMTAADLAELITDKTKVIILNSPANPTGGLIEAEALAEMAQVIRDKAPADVRVYSDEIYENIIFDGKKHASIASEPGMEELTLIASGHSKSFAMTGWRLGYVVLPTVEEAEVFKNFNINLISCTPPFIQEAGRVAIESPESAAAIAKMVAAFDERRKVVVEGLNNIPGITCVMPKGAFYVFPNVAGACESLGAIEAFDEMPAEQQKKSSPSTLLQMFVLYRYGVALMDRPSFCRIGSEGEHYLRLSTATDLDNLQEGLRRIEAAVADADGFASFVAEGIPA
ncbi:MAG: aminotransferase class I/II-fold pyridoxal phosphate-dependent enzyme [Acidobacteriota bacterium]